ncbi:MAG: hypothetical protein LQ340_004680 [Diploschistes diacapsis]|nr:MAG: hypothetical protein LQ340_004680 [Diploschistes diacapsis]
MTRRDPSNRNGGNGGKHGGWSLSGAVKEKGGHLGNKLADGWSKLKDDQPVSPGSRGSEGGSYFGDHTESTTSRRGPLTAPFVNHRQEIHAADSPNIPSISRDPPSAPLAQIAPWETEPSRIPATARLPPSKSFFLDDTDDGPGEAHRPGTAQTDTSESYDSPWRASEERQSSLASSTSTATASRTSHEATGSRAQARNFVGKLALHEVAKGGAQPYYNRTTAASTSSLRPPLRPRASTTLERKHERAVSPSSLKPRTPQPQLPSSEVAPWVFQDFEDIPQYGDAPIKQRPSGLERSRYEHEPPHPASAGHSHHHFHLPGRGQHGHQGHHHGFGQRHNRSKEDNSPSSRDPFQPRPSPQFFAQLNNSSSGLRAADFPPSPSSPMASRSQLNSARLGSPLPSASAADRSPGDGSTSAKRSLFDRIRRHKPDKGNADSLRSLPGSQRSLEEPGHSNFVKLDPIYPKKARDASIATFDSGATTKPNDVQSDPASRKESKLRLLGHSHGKSLTPSRSRFVQDGEKTGKGPLTGESSYWNLDTNLDDMEGIVSAKGSEAPWTGGIPTGVTLPDGMLREGWESALPSGAVAWDAPDSWAVKRVEDEVEAPVSQEMDTDDTGLPYGLRVFRIDGTFATLSTPLNTTAAEILQILGKKSFLQDELNTYQIIMKKNDIQKQLSPGDRPVAIQRHLLEQAGYRSSDGIEEIGRDDNSYLCRFTFVPTKITGYYSLEKDSGLDKMSKFSNVDLTARSLVTIPIALYKKAGEILTLNLSRNLALDVPKDFIQSCVHLREIKFTGNEAWQLPASFGLASKLTVLDVSNNYLTDLEHAQLGKLQNLVSIKLANNKLTTLPSYISEWTQLRSLVLSTNYFSELPNVVFDLQSLVDLDISFNNITELPKVGQLRSLERFWATNNQLSGSFPEQLKELDQLKEIDIRFNKISSMDVFSKLPNLEQLMIGHNNISRFEGTFKKLKKLQADHNPITRFEIQAPMPTLTSLNLASAKLAHLDDSLFERVPNVTKLTLNKNLFATLSTHIGRLTKLEYLNMAKNALTTLPPTIGCLQELRFLDLHECNIRKLPPELWFCAKLDTLNLSSNVLESFPKPSSSLQPPTMEAAQSGNNAIPPSPGGDEPGRLEDVVLRRPSQGSSSLLSVGSSPAGSTRKNSIVSVYGPGGRKASVISRSPTVEANILARKDSNLSSKLTTTFAGSLKQLLMADNRLGDDVFDMISLLPELRSLNLSYNFIDDVPQNALRRWPHLHELYLSGNELTSLPSDDLAIMDNHPLTVLYLNGNKFSHLPAELGKVRKLACLDIGSNLLKYNVTNWRYDWNWNFNQNLKYLNFSGNKRLEIKPPANTFGSGSHAEMQDLTNFTALYHLRVLGLMDVTLTIHTVPEENPDRRVRTSGTTVGTMKYGMADSLGKHEHLSISDLVVPRFRGRDAETLLGMFDGQSLSSAGSTVAKFLHENFASTFTEELARLQSPETPQDALRRTFLSLNKSLATAASQTLDGRTHRLPSIPHRGSISGQGLSPDDLHSGGVATVLFLDNMELYVANVGDAQAMLMHSDGSYHILTEKHDPAYDEERERIRETGGFVSRYGRLNDSLEVSRAFGYIQHVPAVMAAPSIKQLTLREQDEMVLIASKELWEYVVPDLAIDVARSERGDLMRASQKLRDLAIAYGATNKLMVMIIGVAELKKRERSRNRGNTFSMGPSQMEDQVYSGKRQKRDPNAPADSSLARLDREILAPTGNLALVFTDIKSSTALWELFPIAMRSAIRIHNELLRRQLRIIGGYEVKTEGDAFMVSFPSATAALLWCFSVQTLLLTAPWPVEILDSIHGQEVLDSDDNVIFRGLSVRMGAHWGDPVCEPDPITKRMDYFGPMVNRASRISSVADGGQITVSHDFITEIQRTLDTYADSDRSSSMGSEDTMVEEAVSQSIRRDLRMLSTQGFEIKDLGERKLKGLENPEYVYMMYPHSLSARLTLQAAKAEKEAAMTAPSPAYIQSDSQLSMDPEVIWELWNVGLRLEMLCSVLEAPGSQGLRPPETGILDRVKNRGGEVSDRVLLQFVEHLVARIETCITTLQIRHLVRPGRSAVDEAAPISDVIAELAAQLAELRAFKEDAEASFAPA